MLTIASPRTTEWSRKTSILLAGDTNAGLAEIRKAVKDPELSQAAVVLAGPIAEDMVARGLAEDAQGLVEVNPLKSAIASLKNIIPMPEPGDDEGDFAAALNL